MKKLFIIIIVFIIINLHPYTLLNNNIYVKLLNNNSFEVSRELQLINIELVTLKEKNIKITNIIILNNRNKVVLSFTLNDYYKYLLLTTEEKSVFLYKKLKIK